MRSPVLFLNSSTTSHDRAHLGLRQVWQSGLFTFLLLSAHISGIDIQSNSSTGLGGETPNLGGLIKVGILVIVVIWIWNTVNLLCLAWVLGQGFITAVILVWNGEHLLGVQHFFSATEIALVGLNSIDSSSVSRIWRSNTLDLHTESSSASWEEPFMIIIDRSILGLYSIWMVNCMIHSRSCETSGILSTKLALIFFITLRDHKILKSCRLWRGFCYILI